MNEKPRAWLVGDPAFNLRLHRAILVGMVASYYPVSSRIGARNRRGDFFAWTEAHPFLIERSPGDPWLFSPPSLSLMTLAFAERCWRRQRV